MGPIPPGDSQPHPVEINLPHWILTCGVDLPRWLFSHGGAIRIKTPEALRQEPQGKALTSSPLGNARGHQVDLMAV